MSKMSLKEYIIYFNCGNFQVTSFHLETPANGYRHFDGYTDRHWSIFWLAIVCLPKKKVRNCLLQSEWLKVPIEPQPYSHSTPQPQTRTQSSSQSLASMRQCRCVVGPAQLPHGQHEDVLLLLVEAQLTACQPCILKLAFSRCHLSVDGARHHLFPVHPVSRHLCTHVVIQRPM